MDPIHFLFFIFFKTHCHLPSIGGASALVTFIKIDYVLERFSIYVVEIIFHKKFHYITASSCCRDVWCDEHILSSPQRRGGRQRLGSKNVQNSITNPALIQCLDNVLFTDQISSTDINQNGFLVSKRISLVSGNFTFAIVMIEQPYSDRCLECRYQEGQ